MKEIKRSDLFELIYNKLCENDIECGRYKSITINGVTIYYTSYNRCNDFWIEFFDKNILISSFRIYETDYIYFDYQMYKII